MTIGEEGKGTKSRKRATNRSETNRNCKYRWKLCKVLHPVEWKDNSGERICLRYRPDGSVLAHCTQLCSGSFQWEG